MTFITIVLWVLAALAALTVTLTGWLIFEAGRPCRHISATLTDTGWVCDDCGEAVR